MINGEPRNERPEMALELWPAGRCLNHTKKLPKTPPFSTASTSPAESPEDGHAVAPSAFLLHRKLLLTFSSLTGAPQPALRAVTAPPNSLRSPTCLSLQKPKSMGRMHWRPQVRKVGSGAPCWPVAAEQCKTLLAHTQFREGQAPGQSCRTH